MNLREAAILMRELGVRRCTLSHRGDAIEVELFDVSTVVPLPPLDPPPALDTPPPATMPVADEPTPAKPAPPPERPMDPGEAQAVARVEEAKRQRKAREDAQREHDRILFAATGAFEDTRIIRTNDEDDMSPDRE